jgi:hypothetical protein
MDTTRLRVGGPRQIAMSIKRPLVCLYLASATSDPRNGENSGGDFTMKRTIVACSALALTAIWGITATANDEQIAQQIIERLQLQRQTAQLQDFNIGVQVEKGTVTMMGNVSSSDHAVLALDIARRIPGVKLVVNDLYVQAPQSVQPVSHVTTPPQAPPPLQPSVAQIAPTTPVAPVPAPPFSAVPRGGQVSPTFAAQTVPAVPQGQPVAQPAQAQPAQAQPAVQAQRQVPQVARQQVPRPSQRPMPFARTSGAQRASFVAPEYAGSRPAQYSEYSLGGGPSPVPMMSAGGSGIARAAYDNPQMPGYAWPSYAAYPNYAAVTYPHQYSATAWPYIGPFYPYPQVPLGWRKVMLEWDDGWWFLDFKSK